MAWCRRQTAAVVIAFAVALPSARANVAASQPAESSPDANESFFADTKAIIAQWRRQYPLLPSRPIAQVVHFSEADGLLSAEWPIARSGAVFGRVSLSDLPGQCIVECRRSARSGGMVASMFEYYEMQPSVPDVRHLQVLSSPQSLQVVCETETPHRFQTTSLIETLDHQEPYPITLRMQIIGDDQQSANLALTALSLTDLEARHPREFEEYLRPMFRQYRQEFFALSVEEKVAWQVLADDWRPPASLKSQLEPLIAGLGADQYAQREKAQAALRQIGEPAALLLRFSDRRRWSPEQKARSDQLISEFFPLSAAQAAALGQDVDFLLDCLASDDSELRQAALKHLDNLLGRRLDFDCNQPAGARLTAVSALRMQLAAEATTGETSK